MQIVSADGWKQEDDPTEMVSGCPQCRAGEGTSSADGEQAGERVEHGAEHGAGHGGSVRRLELHLSRGRPVLRDGQARSLDCGVVELGRLDSVNGKSHSPGLNRDVVG